jgi:hypothetical protein
MNLAPRWPLVRVPVGLAVAAVVGMFLAPAAARAECGDYVHLGAPIRHEASWAKGPGQSMPPAENHRPCNSPLCTGGPPAAPPVPVFTTAERDQWPSLLALTELDDSKPQAFPPEEGRPGPIRRPTSIFHPPRLY